MVLQMDMERRQISESPDEHGSGGRRESYSCKLVHHRLSADREEGGLGSCQNVCFAQVQEFIAWFER